MEQKKQQETEKKPELTRKEAVIKDLKDVIMKHNVDYINYCKKVVVQLLKLLTIN